MESILSIAISNAVMVTGMAIVVLIISRIARRPALTHCLWLLVLLKLLTPPVFEVPFELPRAPAATDVANGPGNAVGPTMGFGPVSEGMADVIASSAQSPTSDRDRSLEGPSGEPIEPFGNTQLKVVDEEQGLVAIEPSPADRNAAGGRPDATARGERGPRRQEAQVARRESYVDLSQGPMQQVPARPAPQSPSPLTTAFATAADFAAPAIPILMWIWLVGSCGWFLLAGSRLYRFNRLLRHAEPAPAELQREANRLSWRLGLEKAPQLFLVQGAISPMLWAFGGRARIFFPTALLDRLDDKARRSLVLHELAHYRRRDHWVRLLEFIVTGLYWWHPVLWWTLREIHAAEEDCCDAWVVSEYWPDAHDVQQRTVYARALVDTIGYLSEARPTIPAAASGIGRIKHLRRRLQRIMSGPMLRELSPRARLAVVVLAMTVFPWLPTFGQAPAASEKPTAGKGGTTAKESGNSAKQLSKTKPSIPTYVEPTDFETKPTNFTFVSRDAWSGTLSPDGKHLVVGYGHWDEAGEVRVWEVATGKVVFELSETKGVRSVAFSPDGTLFVSGNFAGEVKLRDIKTGGIKHQFKEQAGSIDHLDFSADGEQIATASNGKVARIWDIASGQIVRTFQGHSEVVYQAKFSPDGKSLLTSSRDRTARVWDIASGEVKHTMQHQNQVAVVAYSPDGKQIATGCFDARLRIFDAATGKMLAEQQGHQQYMTALGYSPDGKLLVTGAKEGAIVYWDPQTHKRLATVVAHADEVSGITFSRDSKQLVTTSWDQKTVKLWDVASRQVLKEFSPEAVAANKPQAILALAHSPDGETVATVMEDRSIILRDAESAKVRHILRGHEDYVLAVTFSPDSKTVASVSYDRTVRLWDVATGKQKQALKGHKNWIFAVAFSPDGKRLATGGYDKTIRLWNVAEGKQIAELIGHTAAVRCIAFSPDGKRLASCSSDSTVKLWDTKTLKETAGWKAHKSTVRAVAFSPDGNTLASGGEDNLVKLWDVPSGKERATLTGHGGMVWCLAFSPEGKTLASGGYDNVIKLWDPANGLLRKTLQGHSAVVTAVVFAPDTSRLLSASLDRSVKVWKAKRPPVQPLSVINADAREARFVIFSPDQSRMITGGADASVKIWDTANGKLLRTLSGHRSGVVYGDVSPDGKLLATGDYGGNVRIWELPTGKPLADMKCSTKELMTVEFSPDGKRLVVASWDKTASMWDVAARKLLWRIPPQVLPVTCATFNPKHNLVATTTGNWREWKTPGEVKLWNADTGQEVANLETQGHAHKVRCARFSPDGVLLATCSADSTIRIWMVTAAKPYLKVALTAPNEVTCLTFLNDWKTLVGGMYGGGVAMWDLTNNKQLLEYAGHGQERFPFQIAASPDGSVVASAAGDVRLWPTSPRREAQRWFGHVHWVHGVAFSPDSRYAITTRGPGNTLRLFEVKTGKVVRVFKGHTNAALCVAISPDGKRALSGGFDNLVRLWDMATGRQLQVFEGHTNKIRGVAFSPDGRLAASGSEDDTVRIWNVETGEQVGSLEPRAGDVFAVEFSPDGKWLLSASQSACILWDYRNKDDDEGKEGGTKMRWFDHPGAVLCARFIGKGTNIATGGGDGIVRIFSTRSGKLLSRLGGHTDGVKDVAFAPGGRLLSASYDGSLALWDLKTSRLVDRLLGHEGKVLSVAVSPDGEQALSGGADRTARLWDLTATSSRMPTLAMAVRSWQPTGIVPTATLRLKHTLKAHDGGAWFVRYSPDGKLIATGGRDRIIRLWNAESMKQVAELKGHAGQVICGEFSPDGAQLVTGGTDKTVKLWDVATGKLVATLTQHTNNVRRVGFSPDGKRLATGSEDRSVIVWDTQVRKVVYKIELPLPVYNLAFSPDGKYLAMSTGDYRKNQKGNVALWDAATGKPIRAMADSEGVSMGLAFSPDGTRLAARNSFLAATIWDTATGKSVSVIHALRAVRPLAFSPDGKRLAGGSSAHSGFLWVVDATHGHLIAETKGHDKLLFSLAFSPDGNTLATASEDGTVKLWAMEPLAP